VNHICQGGGNGGMNRKLCIWRWYFIIKSYMWSKTIF